MYKSRFLTFLALCSMLVPLVPRPSLGFSGAEQPSPASQAFDQAAVKRITKELALDTGQAEKLREILDRHAARLGQLWNRQQGQPYSPQLQADKDNETKAIRDELGAYLTEDQKSKLAGANVDPLPGPPGFIPIDIRPRSELGPVAAGKLIPAVYVNPKNRAGRLTDDQKILNLLNRMTYGPLPGDVESVKQIGVAGYIDQQLHPEVIDDSELQSRLDALPTIRMDTEDLYKLYPQPNVAMERVKDKKAPPVFGRPQQIVEELLQQKLVRAVDSKRQLQEVMTDFWFNHFNVFAQKNLYMMTSYERDVIAPNAMGKFHDLLLAVAQSPAMMFYLDNWLSAAPDAAHPGPPALPRSPTPKPRGPAQPGATALKAPDHASAAPGNRSATGATAHRVLPVSGPGAPQAKPPSAPKPAAPKRGPGINENYGRELMELHTLGVNGGYTQKDVQEVARCFTGWTIDQPFQNPSFVFRPWMHDRGSKTVLGIKIPGGGGISDGLRVIDILSRQPATARFISKELCQRFVSDDPSQKLVERIAQVFLKTDGDIRQVLIAIFNSPEFNSPATFRSKVKSPLELAASAIRALGGSTDGGPQLQYWVSRMGEPLYQYMAPTGYGEDSSRWVNSGVFLDRLNFVVTLANNQIQGTSYNPAALVLPRSNPAAAADALTALIVHTGLSDASRKALQIGLKDQGGIAGPGSSGGAPLKIAYPAHPASSQQAELSEGWRRFLAQATALLMGSTEFQRK
ncbi:MAG TPA: DUF1800 domain-containing protein [Blastocatellia bacterium]|nr:DUF1800 domain-containing protein [Blastocatellia bacterium]